MAREASSTNTVPKGYLAVCVGEEQKRFIIPMSYLGHQAFHLLLREAEEEFGFQQTGVLRIPCEVSVFESVLKKLVDEKKEKYMFSIQEYYYCRFNADDNNVGCCLPAETQPTTTPSHQPQSPMCR